MGRARLVGKMLSKVDECGFRTYTLVMGASVKEVLECIGEKEGSSFGFLLVKIEGEGFAEVWAPINGDDLPYSWVKVRRLK